VDGMIFVTVSGWPFERLVKEMDSIAKGIKEKVIMQIGDTKFKPKHAEYFRYTTIERIEDMNKKARVVVAHAGAGCIITALKFGRPTVVVPRRKKFDEHVDDHQMIIAKFLERKGIVQAVYNIKNLEKKIDKTKKSRYKSEKKRVINFLKSYLKGLEVEISG
jgi:beta-1,4-N-acetylglucosaminyltransferase